MEAKEALIKIKNMLFGEQLGYAPTDEKEPIKAKLAVDVTLENGTLVSVSALEVGGTVTLDGKPAPDADHKLKDGTIVTTVGGVITKIEPAAKVEVEVEAVDDKAKEEEMKKIKEMMDAQAAAFSTLKNDNKNLSEAVKGLFSLVEKMAATSVKAPTEKTTIPYEQMTNFQKLKFNRGEL